MRDALVVIALATLLTLSPARTAFAHAVFWTINTFGTDVYGPVDAHYHVSPFCTWCTSPDYMYQTTSMVWQSYAGQGNFYWDGIKLPGGAVYGSGQAYYGPNTWIFDGQGVGHQVYSFSCQLIDNTSIFLTANIWNNGTSGYWYQDAAYGSGGQCLTAYTNNDKMAITAGP